MIKQIKPNSLSHKFLSLIFEKHEIRRGINICDVPWRALKKLSLFLTLSVACTIIAGLVLVCVLSLLFAIAGVWYVPVWAYKFTEFGLMSWITVFVCILLYILQEICEGSVTLLPSYLKKESSANSSPPSLISIWWKSFKEKTCVKIVVDSEAMMEGK